MSYRRDAGPPALDGLFAGTVVRMFALLSKERSSAGIARPAAATASVNDTPSGGSSATRHTGRRVRSLGSRGTGTVRRSRHTIAVTTFGVHVRSRRMSSAHRPAASWTLTVPAGVSGSTAESTSKALSSRTKRSVGVTPHRPEPALGCRPLHTPRSGALGGGTPRGKRCGVGVRRFRHPTQPSSRPTRCS